MTSPKKTHQQIFNEWRDANNARYEAEKLGRHKNVEKLDAKIAELRSMLPPPRGTKARWK